PRNPVSLANSNRGSPNVSMKSRFSFTSMLKYHMVICPAAPVANAKPDSSGLYVIVCTPSENVKEMGFTPVSGMFAGRGGRERQHSRHEVARGVFALHVGEGVPCILVRGGHGLNRGGIDN